MINEFKRKGICYSFTVIVVAIIIFCGMSRYFCLIMDIQSDAYSHLHVATEIMKIRSIEDVKIHWGNGMYPIIWLYPLWHLGAAFTISIFQNMEYGYGVWNGILITITFLFTNYFIQRHTGFTRKYIALLCACMMLFAGPLYFEVINKNYYLGQFTSNVWHNPSTIIIKPISILIFFLYYDIVRLENVKKNQNIKISAVAILLCISAFCKPNWYQVFVPGIMGYVCISSLFLKEKWKKIAKVSVLIVLPVLLIAVIQFFKAFGGGGIGIGIGEVWLHYNKNIVGSFMLSYLFPCLLVCFKKVKLTTLFQINSIVFCSAFSQFSLFYRVESPWAGDFLWGVYLATYILFMVCVIELINSWTAMSVIGRTICTMCFLMHVFWGVIYWWSLLMPQGNINPNFCIMFGF